MKFRTLGLALPLFWVAMTGCLENEVPDNAEETPPPLVRELPGLLYLTFPDPCPDDNTGSTTYNLSEEERRSGHDCGPNHLDHVPEPVPCGIFHVHDDEYRVRKNDKIHAGIGVIVGPTIGMNVYFTWRDVNGVIATFTRPVGFFPGDGIISMEFNTTILRDSIGTIALGVKISNDFCRGVATEGTFPSFFEVNADTPYLPRHGQS